LSEEQRRYAARDVIWLWRLCPLLFRDIAPQISAYRVQLTAVPAVARMNCAGIAFDLASHGEALQVFADEDKAACEAYRAACQEMGRPELAAKVPRSDGEVAAFFKAILTAEELENWKRVDKPWELSTARAELRKARRSPDACIPAIKFAVPRPAARAARVRTFKARRATRRSARCLRPPTASSSSRPTTPQWS
jgi:hypothetical protein